MKIFKWFSDNILFLISLFLLAFIPLYPKLPIIDITHTWVYIRAEDFFVAFALLIWIVLLLYKKVSFKTPLTMPIMLFWIVGVVATLHGILLIFPTLDNVFPNVALLNYLRRIEYVSLFFIAYSGIKDKRVIPYVIGVLTVTLLLVSLYGIGQKYLGFPAYLTMNEEFAKGTPITLSPLSRVSSTFGGHYDLAAYLVLIIPLITSMIFAFRNYFIKIILLIAAGLGFVVLFMTVSRVSFFVLILALILMLYFQKKKLAIISIIFLFLMGFLFLNFSSSLLSRFGNTVKEVDVLVDAKRGEAIGQVKEVSTEPFKNKIIRIKFAQTKDQINAAVATRKDDAKMATKSALVIIPSNLPPIAPLVLEPNAPTGESLPQGTGYINLTLAPISKKVDQFFYQTSPDEKMDESEDTIAIRGNFLIKRVVAYDLSFTTRFQGEWPRAIGIFKKDILFGGGYSATGLAVDNNYFRILGEVGLLGFISYFGVFLIAVIYIKKLLPEVDSPVVRSFVFGFLAGSFGLVLNAVLIDVFEASKIAFVFWLLVGITIGTLHLYQNKEIDLYGEFKKAVTSTYAVIIYLFVAVIIAFSTIPKYYFVGDDFTWFRWIADCNLPHACQSLISTIFNYFTDANGFFYRPGAKIYFLLMYKVFWLNQTAYHIVSIILHFTVAMLVFLISKKILKNFFLAALTAFLFIILSGYSEAVFWISSTGFLFTAVFSLSGLFFFILWEEKKKNVYFVLSLISIILSPLFHELGIVVPAFLALYRVVMLEESIKGLFKKNRYVIFFLPIFPYLLLRLLAQSHWFNGDYSYSLIKLPFNFVGNAVGYLMLTLFGPASLSIYEKLRIFSKNQILLTSMFSLVGVFVAVFITQKIIVRMTKEDRKIVIFGFLFFIIALLPFLGLGNITFRYSYLSSFGFILLFVFFLKKAYGYLIVNGRDISIASMIIVVGVFSMVHIIQLQKVQGDWNLAGEKSQTFLTSLNELYSDSWAKEPMNFYFVNVPIRVGDAWVFPVGLNDAVWFVFRNENIGVHQLSSVEQALDMIKDPTSDKVFVFDDRGALTEHKKPQNAAVIPVKK